MISAAIPAIDFKLLEQSLNTSKSHQSLYQKIVDAPFEQRPEITFLFLGFVCLYLGEENKTVRLAAASDTEQYRLAINAYNFKAADFQLSLETDTQNDIIKAIKSGQPQATSNWGSVSRQAADLEQVSLNQANSGIAYSVVYPLDVPMGGALMYSYFQYEENIGELQHDFMRRYANLVSQFIAG